VIGHSRLKLHYFYNDLEITYKVIYPNSLSANFQCLINVKSISEFIAFIMVSITDETIQNWWGWGITAINIFRENICLEL